MPTTSLTVDNELLSATSIEAAREARDMAAVTLPFISEHNRLTIVRQLVSARVMNK